MRVELNRNSIGQTVLDIIPEPKDNKWEISEFHKFIEEARKFNIWIDVRNESGKGDLIRFNINKHE